MKAAVTLSPERVAWFAAYLRLHPRWGVFSLPLEHRMYTAGADGKARDLWAPDVREAAEWFDKLTPSQRARLGQRARDAVDSVRR